ARNNVILALVCHSVAGHPIPVGRCVIIITPTLTGARRVWQGPRASLELRGRLRLLAEGTSAAGKNLDVKCVTLDCRLAARRSAFCEPLRGWDSRPHVRAAVLLPFVETAHDGCNPHGKTCCMSELLFELPLRSADRAAGSPCLIFKGRTLDYGAFAGELDRFASALIRLGLGKLERVAVYLPKQPENVVAMFGTARAGCVFVPVNPLLKPAQIGHILRDCSVRALVTS